MRDAYFQRAWHEKPFIGWRQKVYLNFELKNRDRQRVAGSNATRNSTWARLSSLHGSNSHSLAMNQGPLPILVVAIFT